MHNLALAILASSMVSVSLKITSKKKSSQYGQLAVNYLVALTMAFLSIPNHNFDIKSINVVILGIIAGFLFFSSLTIYQLNTKYNGIILSSTFAKLGIIIPTIISIIFFKEIPTILQCIGFLLAIFAVIFINTGRNYNEGKSKFKMGLILLLLIGGLTDSMSKIYSQLGPSENSSHYLFFTFLTAFLCAIFASFIKKEKIGKTEIVNGLAIGIPNFLSGFFLLKSVAVLPAVIAYPTYSTGTIAFVSIVGVLFFKEKLSQRQWLSIFIICIALVLLNI